jgi:hypothetical protein
MPESLFVKKYQFMCNLIPLFGKSLYICELREQVTRHPTGPKQAENRMNRQGSETCLNYKLFFRKLKNLERRKRPGKESRQNNIGQNDWV